MDRSQKDKIFDILDSYSGELLGNTFSDDLGNYCTMGLLLVRGANLEPDAPAIGVSGSQIARVFQQPILMEYGFEQGQWDDIVSINDGCDDEERKQCVKDWIESL